jgi:hypothetical protein
MISLPSLRFFFAVTTTSDITLRIEACNKSADSIRDGTDYIAGLEKREVTTAAVRPMTVAANM